MTGDYNLIDTEYKSTLQNLVNRVIITNSKGNQIKVIEDAESIQKIWPGSESYETER